MLISAAILLFLVSFAHSYLGERYILRRLFRGELPALFGSDWFTKRTLRFAWHITTVMWVGFAIILLAIHFDCPLRKAVLMTISLIFFSSGVLAAAFSKFRHLSWIVFVLVGIFSFLSIH